MLRYGLYTRKSHDDPKRTEKSIDDQLFECHKIAEHDGLLVTHTWKESKSAKTPGKRLDYKELVSLIEAGELDAILCWHINRLVRNMEEGGKLVQLLIDGKIREIRTPHAIYRAGDNILAIVIEAASATQYSINLKNDVSRSMDRKFQAGGLNNMAPQGYLNARDPMNSKIGIVVIDKKRFVLLRKAWDLILTETCTVQAVVETLNTAWGYRTRRTLKGGGGPVGHAAIYGMFSNPFYAGFVRRKGELVAGRHRPMVTAQEFERVQEILGRHRKAHLRKRTYAFTGMMTCRHCRRGVTAELKHLKNGTFWEMYRCTNSRNRCTSKGMGRSTLVDRIGDALASITIDEEAFQIGLHDVLEAIEGSGESAEVLHREQKESLVRADERLAKLAEMWMSGLITDRSRYQELEQQELKARNDLLLGIEKSRLELEHMRANARAAFRFSRFAKETFVKGADDCKRAIAMSLATGYLFDGIGKEVTIQLHPLLLRIMHFIRLTPDRLEPKETSYQTNKKVTFRDSFSFGRGTKEDVDLSRKKLLEALRGPLFPDLDFLGMNES